jgi:hypothetical protein
MPELRPECHDCFSDEGDSLENRTAEGEPFRDSLGDSPGSCLREPFRDTAGDALGGSLGESLGDAHGEPFEDCFGDSVGGSLGESLGESLNESLGESLGEALNESFGDCLGEPCDSCVDESKPLGVDCGACPNKEDVRRECSGFCRDEVLEGGLPEVPFFLLLAHPILLV